MWWCGVGIIPFGIKFSIVQGSQEQLQVWYVYGQVSPVEMLGLYTQAHMKVI